MTSPKPRRNKPATGSPSPHEAAATPASSARKAATNRASTAHEAPSKARQAATNGPRTGNEAGTDGAPVRLLSGGNPQIAKADGDAPVQAYIRAMPGWKSAVGHTIDRLITDAVPGVQKAVRWNSPFYAAPGRGWFVSFHVLTRYVKVTFFDGMSLQPIPPGGTERSGQARWIDLYENDPIDEPQMTRWIQQAARLPGWKP